MTAKFSVTGLNQLKLLNSLNKEGITVKKIIRNSPKQMTFSVAHKDRQRTAAILDRQYFTYEVDVKSIKDIFSSAFLRIGLLVGAILMLVCGVIASTHLWKIEVNGNERIDDLTIIRALAESGITVGAKKNFDRKFVEETLLELDDVSAVSAQIVGTTLKVEIVESAVLTPPVEAGDIVSLYDAEVTRIIVTSGNAKVKIGDRVPVGTLLIEGVEYDTEGNPLINVNPSGTVYGKVNFTYSEIASLGGGYARTGKCAQSTVLRFYGMQIGKNKSPEFKFETQKTVTRIGSFLPLYSETTYYYELEEVKYTLEELLGKTKDKAVNTLIIKAGGNPVNVTANSRKISDDVYRITVHIEAEVSIGGKRID